MRVKHIHCFGWERIPKSERPVPKEFTVNCLSLRNPHRVMNLRDKTGFDQEVVEDVLANPKSKELIEQGVRWLLDADVEAIGVACKSGKHRAVVIANVICQAMHKTVKKLGLGFDVRVTYYSQETVSAWLKMQLTPVTKAHNQRSET